MARNIVICSDGTGQDGGVRPDQRLSNVYKLYRASRIGPDSRIDPEEQIAFYDPGLGTDDDVHGFTRLKRNFSKLAGSVTGRGIATNIIDCYEFICNYWEPGDRIFLVGFSRGAYTARCIAQVLALCGVPRHASNDPTMPFERFARSTRLAASRAVHDVYEHGAGHPRDKFEAERDEKGRRFRVEFGSDDSGCANASPYFIGVFDTVAALGAAGGKWWGIVAGLTVVAALPVAALAGVLDLLTAWGFLLPFGALSAAGIASYLFVARRRSLRSIDDFPAGTGRHAHHIAWHADNYDRGLSGHVGYARQASAIDETRLDFPRVPWGRNTVIRPRNGAEPEPLVQLFFAGNHSDIGGSYPEPESRLSDIALEWMIGEATSLDHPLILDRDRLITWPDAGGFQHSEPVAVRQAYLFWVPAWAPKLLRQGWAEGHRTSNGFPVHPCVFARFAAGDVPQAGTQGPYRPIGLRHDPRFAPYWGDADTRSDAAAAVLSTCTFALGEALDVTATPGIASAGLAALLERQGSRSGAAFLPALTGVDDSGYFDGLANDWLLRDLAKQKLASIPFAATDPKNVSSHGRLVFGLSLPHAREIARRVGQPLFLMVGADASLAIERTFP